MYDLEIEETALVARRTKDNTGHCVGSFGTITVKYYHQINFETFEQGETYSSWTAISVGPDLVLEKTIYLT